MQHEMAAILLIVSTAFSLVGVAVWWWRLRGWRRAAEQIDAIGPQPCHALPSAAEAEPAGSPYRHAQHVGVPADRESPVRPRRPLAACPACGARNLARCDECLVGVEIGFGDPPGHCHGIMHRHTTPVARVRVERVTAPAYCSPAKRLRVTRWRRCAMLGEHLHQRCLVCGCAWVCDVQRNMHGQRSSVDSEG